MSRSVLVGLLLVACGPSAGDDGEACSKADVVVSGALVGLDRSECDPCPLDASYAWITLETTCEPGIEWTASSCLIDVMRATNLATREESTFEIPECPAGDIMWTVAPGDPMAAGGPLVRDIVDEPGDYAFVAELISELDPAMFEGAVQ
ncbi:MAG: hypothetical protein AAGF11_45725 [Myxococcota bacterium]